MSLYERTISFILHYIDEHKLDEGARLPTEPELAVMAGVSMVTVRRALGLNSRARPSSAASRAAAPSWCAGG